MSILFLASCNKDGYKEVKSMKQFNSLAKHVIEIDMISQPGSDPNTWANVFPVRDSLEIQEILNKISQAELKNRDVLLGKILLLKTKNNRKFFIRVVINDSTVCGKFFESVHLKKYLDLLEVSRPKKLELNLPEIKSMPFFEPVKASEKTEPNLEKFEF
jgi:hypothetical protein